MVPEPSNFLRNRIQNALTDLDHVADIFHGQVKAGIDTVYAVHVKSRMAVHLAQMVRDLQAYFSETVALGGESPILRLIPFVEKTLASPLSSLTEENQQLLVLVITREISPPLEKALLASHLPAALVTAVERDVRRLASYLSDMTGLRARDGLARVSQIVAVLDNPTRADAAALCKASSTQDTWRLKDAEVAALLASRPDW